MLRKTESVFSPDPDEQKKTRQQQRIPICALENITTVPGKDVATNAGRKEGYLV